MDSWGEWGRRYSRNRTDLSHRAIFAVSDPSDPIAAITNYNNPLSSGDQIRAAVEQGLIVRWKGKEAILALYHDQGLAPFKALTANQACLVGCEGLKWC